MSAIEHFASQLRSGDLPGTGVDWLSSTREAALADFNALGFPSTRAEEWKYTKVSQIEKKAFTVSASSDVCMADIEPFLFAGLDAHRMVFVNGLYQENLSDLGRVDGVRMESLAAVLANDAAAVEAHLTKVTDAKANGFAALNAADMRDGAYVAVARGKVMDKPLHMLFVATGDNDVFSQPRTLIVAEESAEASVIEHYVSLKDGAYFTNAVTEVACGANASVKHYKIQQESKKAFHIATLEATQQRDSRFICHSISLGALIARNDINSQLHGEGADATMSGVYIVNGRQHMDFHTRVDHIAPHCTSNEVFRGVLDDRGRGVFNGKVYVHEGAIKTDSVQKNDNLLLSKNAEVDTKPQLEIYNDDVKCAHGATVGQMDENHLFYLRSRGLDPLEARSLLIFAFVNEVMQKIDLEPVRIRLETDLIATMPKAGQLEELVK